MLAWKLVVARFCAKKVYASSLLVEMQGIVGRAWASRNSAIKLRCADVSWRFAVEEQHLFAWFKCNWNRLFRFQLTLLSTNSISLLVRRKSPAISFFSHFSISTLSVFLFVIKLTLPFLLSSILTARIHVERAWDGASGVWHWMVWC